MRSTTVLLAIIGCIALYPEVALGREVPVYVYRDPPTMTPTTSPSISVQPSLRPSLTYETKQQILISQLASVQNEEDSKAAAASSFGFGWIIALVFTLAAFVGVLHKLKKRRRIAEEATQAAQAPAKASKKESKKTSNEAGHLDLFDATSTSKEEETDGWSSWLPWTNNNEEVEITIKK